MSLLESLEIIGIVSFEKGTLNVHTYKFFSKKFQMSHC